MINTIKLAGLFLILIIIACNNSIPEAELEVLRLQTQTAFKQGDYRKALENVEKILEIDNSDYLAWANKGQALFQLGKLEEGIVAENKAIELNPEYYKAYGYRGAMLSLQKKYEEAQPDLEVAAKHEGGKWYEALATNYYSTGNYEKSIATSTSFISNDSTNYKAWINRSVLYRRMKEYQKAIDDVRYAISLQPNNPNLYGEEANINRTQGNYQKNIPIYTKIIEITKDIPSEANTHAYNYNNRGFAYHKLGDNKSALKDINRSLELLPTNSYAFKNRGIVYLNLKQQPKACADFEKAKELGYTKQYGNEVENLLIEYCQ